METSPTPMDAQPARRSDLMRWAETETEPLYPPNSSQPSNACHGGGASEGERHLAGCERVDVPTSLLEGLRDIEEGRTGDMEKALREPWPDPVVNVYPPPPVETKFEDGVMTEERWAAKSEEWMRTMLPPPSVLRATYAKLPPRDACPECGGKHPTSCATCVAALNAMRGHPPHDETASAAHCSYCGQRHGNAYSCISAIPMAARVTEIVRLRECRGIEPTALYLGDREWQELRSLPEMLEQQDKTGEWNTGYGVFMGMTCYLLERAPSHLDVGRPA